MGQGLITIEFAEMRVKILQKGKKCNFLAKLEKKNLSKTPIYFTIVEFGIRTPDF